MKKWIRWQGLIAFVIVIVTVSLLWFVFADALLKRLVEQTGTQIIGARVELKRAKLSFFPIGGLLSGLQVTNPEEPMRNAVEAATINFSIDPLNLLLRKVIIDEMRIDGVRLNTPRKVSGVVAKRPVSAPMLPGALSEKFKLPDLKIRDVSEILEKEELLSLKLIEDVRTDVKAERVKWENRLAQLPDKNKLDDYKRRIKELKSAKSGGLAGILGGVSGAVELQKEIKKDVSQIQSVRDELNNSMNLLRRRLKEAEQAPQKDINRLKQKYSLSPEGLSHISRLLFGGKLADWTATALTWYSKLKPYLAGGPAQKSDKGVKIVKPVRGKGVNVRFKEDNPIPDFLIRIAHASIELPLGVLAGQLKNITTDQAVLGVPLTFAFSGEKLKGTQAMALDGSLDHIVPDKARDKLNLRVSSYRIENMKLSANKQLPVFLQSGLADFGLRTAISGESLTANLMAHLQSARLAVEQAAGSGQLVSTISSALTDINKFNLQAKLSGTLDDYDIQLSSDIDRVLKDALGKLVKAQVAGLEKKLSEEIGKKVNGPLASLKEDFGGLTAIDEELAGHINQLSGLL